MTPVLNVAVMRDKTTGVSSSTSFICELFFVMDVVVNIFFALLVIASANSAPPPAIPFQATCATGLYPPQHTQEIPTHIVDLDLPPQERWTLPLKGQGKNIENLMKVIKEFAKDNKLKFVMDLVDKDLGWLANTLPAPFGDEIKGIAKATGIHLGEMVLYNIVYEVSALCTSIVAETEHGKLYHARNLDFGGILRWNATSHSDPLAAALRPLIANYHFQRGGKIIYKSVGYGGYVGVLTAIKPHLFTFSIDERNNIDVLLGILKWIFGNRSEQWMGFLTRNVMEKAMSYSEAKKMLSTQLMVGPAYFILAGNESGEATVITRDRKGAVDTWDIDVDSDRWYLVETNYDHWKKPVDIRRRVAMGCMDKVGKKNINFSTLFNVLSTEPVLNGYTTYTSLMQVHDGSLESYIQECLDP